MLSDSVEMPIQHWLHWIGIELVLVNLLRFSSGGSFHLSGCLSTEEKQFGNNIWVILRESNY
jgi:hypothetical protein